eukprot:ANDGO_06016.mRNA.1 hypothetical protein
MALQLPLLVTAAILCDKNDPGRVLLVKRARAPFCGSWALVGGCGAFEKIVNPEEAVVHEVECDLGVTPVQLRFFHYYFCEPKSVVLVFAGHLEHESSIRLDPQYVSAWKWFDVRDARPNELGEIAFEGGFVLASYARTLSAPDVMNGS